MPRSQMLPSVFQAVCLDLLEIIISHYLKHTVFSTAEGFFSQFSPSVNATTTATNSTISGEIEFKTSGHEWGKFFTTDFPRMTVIFIATNSVWYQWHLWLERMLPTRSRNFATAAPSSAAAEKTEGDEEVEEEIIKKWIAQGKIKRSSINWMNTFLKWILQMTLGLALRNLAWSATEAVVRFKNPKWFVAELKILHWKVLSIWFTTIPLSSLAGFIVIPTYKRIVFDSGVALATTIFLGAFVSKLVPWMARQDWVIEALEQNNGTVANAKDSHLSIGDEL